jgi:hypothetical protein
MLFSGGGLQEDGRVTVEVEALGESGMAEQRRGGRGQVSKRPTMEAKEAYYGNKRNLATRQTCGA